MTVIPPSPATLIRANQPLRWDEPLCVGVRALDDDHARLFDRFNDILATVRADGEPTPFKDAVNRFVSAAQAHFAAEERLMKAIGYPGYGRHKAVHRRLIRDAEDFMHSIDTAGHRAVLIPAVARYFRHWLVSHISSEDRAIGTFVHGDTERPLVVAAGPLATGFSFG